MPPNTVSVTRPGKYGNPFKIGQKWNGYVIDDIENCLDFYRVYVSDQLLMDSHWLDGIKGKNLACFCKEGSPCHADILLELANS